MKTEINVKLPVRDNGKVRMGGWGPTLKQAETKDAGKVRMGGWGPTLPRKS